MFALALLVALSAGDAPADSLVQRPPALAPRAAAPAALIVHSQPALPLVALRLSLLADDPAGYAGVGHLLQHLHYPALQEQVARVGGQVRLERNSDALVYTVVGPAAELAYLGGVLRSALAVPRVSETTLRIEAGVLAEERLAEWETAAGHVRAALRQQLFPQDLPATGTVAAARRWTVEALPGLWAQMYRPERVSVVAVGDVNVELVARAFGELPEPPAAPLPEPRVDTLPPRPPARAEATQGWLALGYAAEPGAEPAALSLAAWLLRRELRAHLPDASVEVEHWWTHHGQALVLVASAPEAALPVARRALAVGLPSLLPELTPGRVRAAAEALRREMLFHSRGPANMASLLGQFADRGGEPDAAQRFYDALGATGAGELERLLTTLAARTPARVELPPQPLPRRP